MAYQYDVFISYRSTSREWVKKLFLPTFQHFLQEEVGKEVNIFVDWHDIQTADAWNERLKYGLLHSKCLVSLMLPTYFESNWCKKEFAVFEYRSRQNGMLSLTAPGGLIIPIILHKGREFPQAINDIQYRDFREYYTHIVDGFTRLKKFQRLQQEISALAKDVAQVLHKPIDWQQDWHKDEWLEVSTDHLVIPSFTVNQPRI